MPYPFKSSPHLKRGLYMYEQLRQVFDSSFHFRKFSFLFKHNSCTVSGVYRKAFNWYFILVALEIMASLYIHNRIDIYMTVFVFCLC